VILANPERAKNDERTFLDGGAEEEEKKEKGRPRLTVNKTSLHGKKLEICRAKDENGRKREHRDCLSSQPVAPREMDKSSRKRKTMGVELTTGMLEVTTPRYRPSQRRCNGRITQ
jgi:hypothetical protein